VRFDGVQGLHGWQWVFVMQGLPACVMGVICYFVLSDTPQQAAWLSSSERDRLTHVLDLDREPEHGPNRGVAAALLKDPIVWVFAFMYFSSYSANVMFTYWMPTMLKESGIAKLLDIGFLSVLPWISGIAGLLIMNFSSDYFRERRRHMALAFAFTITGLLAAVILNKSPIILVICFSVANFGGMACGSLFWTMPTTYLSQRAAPAGIAMISTLGSLCGFFIPIVLGIVRNATGGFTAGVLLIAAMMAIALVLIMRVLPTNAVRVWAEE
jgi:sugar phosphate permease